jgi:glycopeptide antibiotics resistance protein
VKARLKDPLPWRIALAFHLVALTVVGYWPAPVDKPIRGTLAEVLRFLHVHGVPAWFDYQFIEASANVAMFIPFGILATFSMPSKGWWHLAGIGLVASSCIELGQLMFIAARTFSPVDLFTNTLGSVIGVSIARWLSRSSSSQVADT